MLENLLFRLFPDVEERPLPTQQLRLSQKNIGPDRNSRVKGEGNVQGYIYVCVCGGWWPQRSRKQRVEGLWFLQGVDLLPESPEVHFFPMILNVSPCVLQEYHCEIPLQMPH